MHLDFFTVLQRAQSKRNKIGEQSERVSTSALIRENKVQIAGFVVHFLPLHVRHKTFFRAQLNWA